MALSGDLVSCGLVSLWSMGKQHAGNSYFSDFGEGGSHIPCPSAFLVLSPLGLAHITDPNLCGQMALCLRSSRLIGKQ